MKYVEVCKALYDYEARTEDELSIKQDDILYVIEKEDDDWWRSELKQTTGEEQGPIGLVPADYLEQVTPMGRVRAEYDYVAQQEEELSFEEGDEMDLLETDDPDWYLVKLNNGQIGLAPSNYVEPMEGDHQQQQQAHVEQEEEEQYQPAVSSIPQAPIMTQPPAITQAPIPPPQVEPVLSHPTGGTAREVIADDAQSWNVHEYDAAKKKKKKGKGNLYIGNGMLCYGSETDKSLPVQQYPILDVTKYLFDGKNLHIEVEGNKQAVLDLQASSKSEAKAILVKISDSTRIAQQSATHLTQHQRQMAAPANPIMMGAPAPPPAAAPSPPHVAAIQYQQEEEEEESNCVPKWGISIYSFTAEGGDELSVEENEQIYVLDYERTDGWWRIQKVDGETGLVPSSYVQFDDDEDDTPVGAAGAAGLAAGAAAAAAAAAGSAHSRADNVEEIRKKREEEERILQQRRIAEEEERESQRRREQEERKRREDEENRRREEENRRREEKRREEEERDRRRQAQEATKRAEAARQKQIEEDYKRKEAERKATLARSASTASKSSSSSSTRHQDLPKPDMSKIRTWTDRSGTFKVEAQFIDFHNGKLRLHKLNGVKIDVPVEKMCAEDVRWVDNHTKNIPNGDEATPSMPPRPPQQQPQQASKPPQKKLNERWDWFDWFMVIGIPMQASLQYASAFKAEKLDDSDIPNLTHKQMKTLGIKEEHVQRIERYIETGQPEDANEDGPTKKEQSQIEKDEELARKLQREWEGSEAGSKSRGVSASARPRPTVSAPKDIHPDLLDFIGTQLTSTDNSKGKAPEKPIGDLVGFNDDAWAPRAETSPIATLSPTKAAPPAPPAPPAAPAGPTPEQIKAAEAERKRIAEEEQIQKIQLMSLQRQAQEQQKQLEQLQALTKQQLELQKQLAMQTGNQQQQQQQQLQMQQVQAQQHQLQQQLAQQPSQLQPSFAIQAQPTAMQMQQPQQTSAPRQRPTPPNKINSDPSLGQWLPNHQQQQQQQPMQTGYQQQQQPQQPQQQQQPMHTGFQQQPMQTGFQQQQPQQQQPSWQSQQLQPQMTGFPASSQPVGQNFQQPMAVATVPLSSILPQPLLPTAAGQHQGGFNNGLQRAQTISAQATGRHWGAATPDNPFGSPTPSPLQAQMTGVQFSTPSPQAFHHSPLQSQQPTGYMQPQMTGFQSQPPQQQQPANSIFTPQGSMQYGQSAFPNNQRPW